jgi:DAK2 domain fusion protein YloV
VITGNTLRKSLLSAAVSIGAHRREVDGLNVFPVPDGDTGTNMSMTMGAAKIELAGLADSAGVGEVAQTVAQALLWGARGNSGVILSLLFRGFAKSLAGRESASSADMADALEQGVEAAYKAVMKPTEGTILTVARESAAAAAALVAELPDIPPDLLWEAVADEAQASLERTPELLDVLKKAGVVDAGGQGLVYIYRAMGAVFSGRETGDDEEEKAQTEPADIPDERNAAGYYEGEITFTYCTEFIVIKDMQRADALSLRGFLEGIGDSAVVVDGDDIIKCHVHTDTPGNALQKALEHGSLTKIKIENMREQHAVNRKATAQKRPGSGFPYKPVDPSNEIGFVAVAAGEGVRTLFKDLGVLNVVSGGQTMNPSTDNILEAIHATPAKTVIVLPNNKNIIMTAEQTVKLADRGVWVLPTKTVPQGLAAMLAFAPELSLTENQLSMVKAAERVGTGQVTFAARDSSFDGHKIKKNEILALENGRLSFVEKDPNKAVARLAKAMIKKDSGFVTLIYGEDINDEQAAEAEAAIRQRLPDSVELALINGGQPVYYYILSVE